VSVAAKICGINSPNALKAAVAGGAAFLGFVFYPPSPRALTPRAAATLVEKAPSGVPTVGVFVDPDDATLAATLDAVPLGLLQLHGAETPARVAAIKQRFGRPVIKAIKVGGAQDLAAADAFLDVADWLMFDARPPSDRAGALPGGNALAFDWRLIAGRRWKLPWFLSGGLTADNVAEAVAISGARYVDVSSGVESAPGVKDPAKIAAFLAAVRALQKPTSAQ
jgi:phosphoribosylanthranilate isomerase